MQESSSKKKQSDSVLVLSFEFFEGFPYRNFPLSKIFTENVRIRQKVPNFQFFCGQISAIFQKKFANIPLKSLMEN